MNGQSVMFGPFPGVHHQHDPALSELDAAVRAGSGVRVAHRACLQALNNFDESGRTTRSVEQYVYPYRSDMTPDEARVWASKVNKVATRLRELETLGLVETRRDKTGKRITRQSGGTGPRFLVYWITDAGREELKL